MSIDMSQFYQVFFEETAEHLASMESLLLALDVKSPDPDQLNAIFRAAHSIKGGSATFGFADLTEVTHVLETLLDRIRKNQIAITPEMVDAFLQAGDVLRGLLGSHQHGAGQDISKKREICVKLDQLSSNANVVAISFEQAVPAQNTGAIELPARCPSVQKIYAVEFVKALTAFPTNGHLAKLLKNVGTIGTIIDQATTDSAVKLSLVTAASEAEIREVFSFFLNQDQLTIAIAESNGNETDVTDKALAAEQILAVCAEPLHGLSGGDYGNRQAADDSYGFFTDPETLALAAQKADSKVADKFDPATSQSGMEHSRRSDDAEERQERQEQGSPSSPLDVHRKDGTAGRRATDGMAPPGIADSSIRVSVGKVDNLVNLVGELVITQAMLAETISKMDPDQNETLVKGMMQLERNSRELQEVIMSVRMMPISTVFSRFQRIVRDSAVKLNKTVQLRIIGESTELDKGLIEKISDPLTHLVRNSLDHGIEFPDARIASGKPPHGTITLRAAHQGGNIVIEVEDDGAGLNRDRILAKARENGMDADDSMTDAGVWQMIFAPGFSTAPVITDVSGRGVGMDVVKKNIESIGGRVEVSTIFGRGTTIAIRLPLTLAILDGLSISVGDQIYIVPLNVISESLQPSPADINEIGDQGRVVRVRGDYLPLVALHQLFDIQTRIVHPSEGIVVILESDNKKIALLVDELVGQHQVVIKSLETNYRRVAGLAGATIMGDGRVAMIVDVSALIKMAHQKVF